MDYKVEVILIRATRNLRSHQSTLDMVTCTLVWVPWLTPFQPDSTDKKSVSHVTIRNTTDMTDCVSCRFRAIRWGAAPIHSLDHSLTLNIFPLLIKQYLRC